MSEITRSELKGQTIELLPAREEMRGFRFLDVGNACFAQTVSGECSTGRGGNAAPGISQTTGENGYADNIVKDSVGVGAPGGSGGVVFGAQTD